MFAILRDEKEAFRFYLAFLKFLPTGGGILQNSVQELIITLVTKPVIFNLFLFLLKLQEPNTDRQLIETSPVLQKLTEFEEAIGVIFTHVRLLARAFTLRTVGFNHLTL